MPKHIFKNSDEVIQAIKRHRVPPAWITEARLLSKTLKALVYGDKFLEELIERIEKIESITRAEARKKYSKDIRDMFSRVLEPRSNVFSASGSSKEIDIKGKNDEKKFFEHMKEFRGNKSITKYLSDYFFELLDVDPNGLLMLEFIKGEDIWPTYKSIDDIRFYHSDGQNIHVVIYEPVKVVKLGQVFMKWRIVDAETDWCILQNGETFMEIPDLTFKHPFGDVPAIILSDFQKLGTELRLSPLFSVEELSKDYARDKSILTLYKFLNGFPIHWRYSQQCQACRGTGKTGQEGNSCQHCNGKGILGKNDVTDIMDVPTPRDNEDVKLAPDLAGFVSPDLETWKQYNADQVMFEDKIHNTIWGTKKVRENQNETATGRFIDIQPVINKLNDFSDNVEWVHNQLANWVLRWVKNNPLTTDKFFRSYGRGFIIEGPDVILERYQTAQKDGNNWTILDKIFGEY